MRIIGLTNRLRAQQPVGSGTAADPSSILTSYEAAGLYTRLTVENETEVSRIPHLGASFSAPLVDALGAPGAAFTLGDTLQLWLWSEDAEPPADVVLWAALTRGALATDSFGAAVMLEAVAGNWRVQHATNNATSWSITNASAVDASTRGGVLQVVVGVSHTNGRVSAYGVDAGGLKVTGVNANTLTGAHNTYGDPLDTISWGAGWATGSGGSAGAVARLSPRLVLVPQAALQGLAA
jgi:hypothetical protein